MIALGAEYLYEMGENPWQLRRWIQARSGPRDAGLVDESLYGNAWQILQRRTRAGIILSV
jgi:hypothetical protein